MRSFALVLPALVSAYVAYAPAEGAGVLLQNGALQNILKNTDKTDKYRYPTDFTRGIEPVSRPGVEVLIWSLGVSRMQAYATPETIPQPQRLLARCAVLLWTRGWSCLHRGGCLAD